MPPSSSKHLMERELAVQVLLNHIQPLGVPRSSFQLLKLARVLLQEFLAIGQILPGLGSEGGGYSLPAAQLHLLETS